MVKGEPLAPPAGRADDFSWPRREVGYEPAKSDVPVASKEPAAPAAAAPAPAAGTSPEVAAVNPNAQQKQAPKKPPQQAPAQSAAPNLRDFFGFGSPAPVPGPAPAPRQIAPTRPPQAPGVPRPPANVGHSAAVQ
jgi:hypothetical protein